MSSAAPREGGATRTDDLTNTGDVTSEEGGTLGGRGEGVLEGGPRGGGGTVGHAEEAHQVKAVDETALLTSARPTTGKSEGGATARCAGGSRRRRDEATG